jgi:hypothetical protein
MTIKQRLPSPEHQGRGDHAYPAATALDVVVSSPKAKDNDIKLD